MGKNNTIVIMAGTHQREIEFSHRVADILLDNYGFDKHSRLDVFEGEDHATLASLWQSKEDNIVIAKLYAQGNGEPSQEWLRTQTLERLRYLIQHKQDCANQTRPPRIAETFGGKGQWTSVHNHILKKFNPLFFIDLHSYHESTKGQTGKGMQINSHANSQYDHVLRTALQNAQRENPQIYGQPYRPIRSSFAIRSEVLQRQYSQNDLITILQSEELVRGFDKKNLLEQEVKKISEQELHMAQENGWYFVNWSLPEPRGDYFCFEAIHWQENQQKATAQFITKYLLPQVRDHQES